MAITEMQARNAKLPSGKKQIKITDGGGLYLLINKHGKYWRYDYRFAGRRKTASIGVYPKVRIKDARKKHNELRLILDNGNDPSLIGIRKSSSDSFELVAREWHSKHSAILSKKHAKTIMRIPTKPATQTSRSRPPCRGG